jgi:hypothetical protein
MTYRRPHINAQITVRELIDVLSRYPKDMPVVVYEPKTGEYIDVQEIDREHSQLVIQVAE